MRTVPIPYFPLSFLFSLLKMLQYHRRHSMYNTYLLDVAHLAEHESRKTNANESFSLRFVCLRLVS